MATQPEYASGQAQAGQEQPAARQPGQGPGLHGLDHGPGRADRGVRADVCLAATNQRSRGGSGIGLTVTKSLVEAMGGRIWAYSAGTNQGSTFSFTLPAAK
mgnify:CR=1 FL=1